MQPNEINTAIVELAGLYDNLNKRWSDDPCSTDAFQAFRQTEYHEIYEKIRNTNIESLALGIIANSLDERILMRLRNLLNDNIQIYETRQNNFANINFHKVYSLHEEQLFADKFALLAKDKEEIQGFPYPTEQEKQMLLKENQIEKNFLENERFEYVRANIWMFENFYSLIYEITKSSCSIIESYFPIKKEGIPVSEPISNDTVLISDPVPQSGIEPDMIFRTRMFEKFLALEQKLMNDKYLNTELHWISLHDNGKPDIKRLVVFLVGLLDNKYFLPGRDPKIKTFFESRYHIKIGQNFEPARRKEHIKEYSMVFYDYHF